MQRFNYNIIKRTQMYKHKPTLCITNRLFATTLICPQSTTINNKMNQIKIPKAIKRYFLLFMDYYYGFLYYNFYLYVCLYICY